MESPHQDTLEGSSPPLFGPDDRPDMPDPGKLRTMSLRRKEKDDRTAKHSFLYHERSLALFPRACMDRTRLHFLAVDDLRLIMGWNVETAVSYVCVQRKDPWAEAVFGLP